MNSVRLFLLVITTFLFLSCFEDADDNGAFASEINDFVWKGMNAAYLYKEEINDLSNNRFSDSQEYATYLNSYEYPEELFESLIFDRQNIDKFSVCTILPKKVRSFSFNSIWNPSDVWD